MDMKSHRSNFALIGILLSGLAMSVGWGFRGDYGHEAGAMVPGALLGLAICLASGRRDWWRRASLMAMCGAIGWAFGGQMSYGKVTGYTASASLPDIAYGYAILIGVLGLHMTPPRSDNWSGCVGLFVALVLYLIRRRNRAALTIALWGFLAGGVGFAVGDFVQMLGRAQWGPIGHMSMLQGLDYWKWMEQLFGLIMGLGVGCVFLRKVRRKLAAPEEDQTGGYLNTVALLFLLLVMMWSNLFKNVRNWAKNDNIPDLFFNIRTEWWFLLVGFLLSAMILVAIIRRRRGALPLAPAGAFGRGQLLFLLILWIAVIGAFLQAFPGMAHKGIFFVHTTFWITAGLCSLIVLMLSDKPAHQPEAQWASSDPSWKPGLHHWLSWLLIPALIFVLAYLTTSLSDEPLPGSHLRFESTAQP